jgi:hypothetical protein
LCATSTTCKSGRLEERRPIGGLSTGLGRAIQPTGYPAAVREQRIRAGQQRVRSTFLAVALLALITGCSSDAEQPSAELPPASSSAAESTPELPPLGPEDFPVPAEARTKDEAGAEAFLAYWIELLNRQQAVPAGEPIRALGPKCQECAAIARRFDEAAAAGLHIEGGEVSVIDGPGTSIAGQKANLSFIARAEASTVRDTEGNPVPGEAQEAQERLPSALEVTWSDSRHSWLASGLSFG